MKNESRDNFFLSNFNRDRANEWLLELIKNCTLEEILWIVRSVSYDLVSYYDNNNKGKIYDDSYSRKQIEQVTQLQRDISTSCDLFKQIIINHNEFNDGYFEERTMSNGKIGNLKKKIKELEDELNEKNV